MRYNLSSGYGQMLAMQIASAVGPLFGKIHVVVNPSDDAGTFGMFQNIMTPDPDGVVRFFTTLDAAYTACTTNANDVILLSANTSHTLTAGIAWSKSRIHVIGMDGGGRLTDSRVKVQTPATDTTGYVLKVTGTGNSFINIKFIQGSTDETGKNVVQMGGINTLYKNCQFTFGAASNFEDTDTIEVLNGEAAGTFIDCEFGSVTLLTTGARQVMLLKTVTTSQPCKQNRFRGCTFLISSSSATALLLKVNSNSGDVLFTNIWENCLFVASVDSAGGAALTNAVASASGLTESTLNFANCSSYSCTGFCDGVTDKVLLYAAIGNGAEAGEAGTPNS